MREVDVLVVGAGPAGSTAAEHAARRGAEVLLIDRREEIGVPVRCGEFLPQEEELRSIFPRASTSGLFDLPDRLIRRRIESIRIFSPRMRRWDLPFMGITTDRDGFDQYLAGKAEGAGAELLTGCAFLSREGREVSTSFGKVRASVVIGADGPVSRVARSVGMPRIRDLFPAVTSQVEGDFEPVCEMYFGNIAPGGYAWIIPKDGKANVGVGLSPRFAMGSVRDHFREFAEWKDLRPGRVVGKMVPMGGPVKRSVKENVILVGDSAGHVMAVNGGGIPIAMICGRLAGEVAGDHVREGRPLMGYESLWKGQVEGPLRTAMRSKAWSNLCWGGQFRLELAMRFLGRRRMEKLIRCRPMFP
ncbi:MAG: geranylgeranyl reductase family protein [Methanomassiliicoccales archaeon]